MHRKNISKITSILLAIVMLVSSIPSFAVAEELEPQAPAITEPEEPKDAGYDCAILKYVDEKEFQSHDYVQRLPAEEDLNTYVFETQDGHRAVYFLDENVKFADDTGMIYEKDLTLVETDEGYKTTCNDIDVTLPIALEEGVSFKYKEVDIALKPAEDTEKCAELSDNQITYPNAFGEGTALVYTPTLSGLKEDIVIDSKDAPETYSFTMSTNGLSVFSDEEGLFLANDEDAEEKIRLGNVWLYDSGDRFCRGEMQTETVTEGQEYIIKIVPDQEFLQDERTEYPVTIDPTMTVSDNTYGAGAIYDAPIFQGQPDENFGDYRYDRLGTPSETGFGVGRTVVRLPGLTGSSVYSSITTAYAADRILEVRFFAKESYGGSTQIINLYPITAGYGWEESTVTWNTIGTNFNQNVNYGSSMSNNAWTGFDITNLVIAWKQYTYSAECGFIMMNANESNNECFDSCESYTSTYRPYVVFVYDSYITINGSGIKDVDEGSDIILTVDKYPANAVVTWTSSDTSIATVSSTGKVTGVKASSLHVTITATISYAGSNHWSSCYVYVTLPDGVYFLKNRQTSKFVDIQGPTMVAGTDIHQWEFNGNNSQRWEITHIGSGYYSIKSKNSTSDIYMAVSGNNTSSGTQIVLGTGAPSSNEGMKWRFFPTTDGGYRIVPQTGMNNNLVMAVESSIGFPNGWKIKQMTYTNDSDYKDEWVLFGKKDLSLSIVGELGNEVENLSGALSEWDYHGFSNYYTNYQDVNLYISKEDLLARMASSKIVIIKTHGNKTTIGTSTDEINLNTMQSLSSDAFSDTKLVIYGACLTGEGGDYDNNLANATVNAGVDSVIAFPHLINSTAFNAWLAWFASNYCIYSGISGKTLQDAVDDALDAISNRDDYSYINGEGELVSMEGAHVFGSNSFPEE